ncbi:hypothetical protein [Streptomyces klenkii]
MTRPRALVPAAVCSLALLLACPGSADANAGRFSYTYVGSDGTEHGQSMSDPASKVCINIPEATEAKPAHSPDNRTDEQAFLFENFECAGTEYVLEKDTGKGTRDTKFRSVLFQN